jgi:CBS domain-containing protein
VVKDGSMVGMVTVGDVKKMPMDKLMPTTAVGDVIARKIYTIGSDEDASAAMKRMGELGIRRLLVVDGGNLMDILSREDLVRAIELSQPS